MTSSLRFSKLIRIILISFSLIFTLNFAKAQSKTYKVACVAFYNLENLYDTIKDPTIDDNEFIPNGPNGWDSKKYLQKIKHLSEVISQIGDEYVKGGPTCIGLSEVENRGVLVDLINSQSLKNSGYDIVHYDSPDRRGVDVALLYKKKDFQVINSKAVRLRFPFRKEFTSRDQLVVCGQVDGEKLYLVVNHWPSRGNGAEYRAEAAKLTRSIVDSITNIDANAKIMVMGDLNDDPIDPSVLNILNTNGDKKKIRDHQLYNPMYNLYKDGIGSLAYRDSWNLFDQIIISKPLLEEKQKGFKYLKAMVFNKSFLINKEGPYKGYPFRTFAGGAWVGGYSDHFPVYLFIAKEK